LNVDFSRLKVDALRPGKPGGTVLLPNKPYLDSFLKSQC